MNNVWYMLQIQNRHDSDLWSEYLTFDTKKEAVEELRDITKYNLRLVKCELLDTEGNRLKE